MRRFAVLGIIAFAVGCTGLLGLETVRFEGDPDAAVPGVDGSDASDASAEASSDDASSSAVSFLVWAGGAVPDNAGTDFPSSQVLIARVHEDGSLDQWKLGPDLPQARYRHSVVGIDNHVFVIGGGDSPANAFATAIYDITIDANGNATLAVSDAVLSPGLADPCSAAANGKVYVKEYGGGTVLTATVSSGKLGGFKASSPGRDGDLTGSVVAMSNALFTPGAADAGTKEIVRLPLGPTFEPEASAWTPLAPAPRAFIAGLLASPLATDGAHLYVVGTFTDGAVPEARVLGATIASGSATWEELEPFPIVRRNHGTTAVAGHLYVAGGINEGGGEVVDVSYAAIGADGKLGTWTKTTPLLSARDGRCALTAVTVRK